MIILQRKYVNKSHFVKMATTRKAIGVTKYSCFSAINQETIPPELPILGDPINDIILELMSSIKPPLFTLDGKKLRLLRSLDRDVDNLSHLVFQVKHL